MSRKSLTSLAALAAAATAVAPSFAQQPIYTQHQGVQAWSFHHDNVLGTSLQITVRAYSRADAVQAEAAALARLDSDARILSAWDQNSELSHWLTTRNQTIAVSPELLDVLERFEFWREQTDGALNASAETAIRLWKAASAKGRTPTDSEIHHAIGAMQQKHWQIDRNAGTVTRTSDAPLALASFTKSYITSRAADAALQHGAVGIMLNVGGDIVTRGDITQIIDVANPAADAENDQTIASIQVRDRAVATSGSYRRGFDLTSSLGAPQFSHILDPRTAQPASSIASSTVIAKDASTAGALATAFSVLSPAESAELAGKHPEVAYLLITQDGQRISSENWSHYQVGDAGKVTPAAYHADPHGKPARPATALWNQNFEVVLQIELARINDPRYRRPYVAVWVEDEDHYPVRTIALWYDNHQRWLPELKSWYRDDQVRNLSEGTDITRTVTSATRAPGKYTLKWDGKDNDGKLVKAGSYTIFVEFSREHGTYEILKHALDFNGKPQQLSLGTGTEGSATLDYRKR